MEPELHKDYPLVLDLPSDAQRSSNLCMLRLDFVPASAAQGAGTLHLDAAQHQARLQLPSAVAGAAPVAFQGSYTPSRESHNCVAVFDGTSFRLELLEGHASLRHAPGKEREAAAQRTAAANETAKAAAPSKARRSSRKAVQPPEGGLPAASAQPPPPAAAAAEDAVAAAAAEEAAAPAALTDMEASFFGGGEDLL